MDLSVPMVWACCRSTLPCQPSSQAAALLVAHTISSTPQLATACISRRPLGCSFLPSFLRSLLACFLRLWARFRHLEPSQRALRDKPISAHRSLFMLSACEFTLARP